MPDFFNKIMKIIEGLCHTHQAKKRVKKLPKPSLPLAVEVVVERSKDRVSKLCERHDRQCKTNINKTKK